MNSQDKGKYNLSELKKIARKKGLKLTLSKDGKTLLWEDIKTGKLYQTTSLILTN